MLQAQASKIIMGSFSTSKKIVRRFRLYSFSLFSPMYLLLTRTSSASSPLYELISMYRFIQDYLKLIIFRIITCEMQKQNKRFHFQKSAKKINFNLIFLLK